MKRATNASARYEYSLIEHLQKMAREMGGQIGLLPKEVIRPTNSDYEKTVLLVQGRFSPHFLKLPKVLIELLFLENKWITVVDSQDALLPNFIALGKPKNHTGPNQSITKIVEHALSELLNVYELDQKEPLSSMARGLANLSFHPHLGHYEARTQRITTLAQRMAFLMALDMEVVDRAANLAKADLLSHTVKHFGYMKGVLGFLLAEKDNEDERVCLAIRRQYWPNPIEDMLPDALTTTVLAIADRMDAIVGLVAINQEKSEEHGLDLSDLILGLVRLISAKKLDLDIFELIDLAIKNYGPKINQDGLHEKVRSLCFEPLKAWFIEKGLAPKVFEALYCVQARDLLLFFERAQLVDSFCKTDEGKAFIQLVHKIKNGLVKTHYPLADTVGAISPELINDEFEEYLLDLLSARSAEVETYLKAKDYQAILDIYLKLVEPVARFMKTILRKDKEEIMVLNRLTILAHFHLLFRKMCDFSYIALS